MVFTRRILVVDDEPIIRTLIADRLKMLGFESWAAADAFEAQKAVKAHDPDALIVDLDLGGGPTGIELITAVAAKRPELGFVLLSNFLPAAWEMRAAKNLAFVRKSEVLDFQKLIDVLEEVLSDAGKTQVSLPASTSDPIAGLTKRQVRVLALLADGLTNQQIAEELGVTKGAIEQAVQRIYAALELSETQSGSRRVRAAKLYSKTMGPSR